MPIRPNRSPAPLPAVPWRKCFAKTAEDGAPGISVLEHCQHVGEVARSLLETLPDRVLRLLGDNPAAVAALHDVGKVSPGFQLKYFASYIEVHYPELAQRSRLGFESLHARVGESALQAYLDNTATGSRLAAIIGAHHGSRDEGAHDCECDETLGGPLWSQERRSLIDRLVQEFGGVSSEANFDPEVLAGLVCVADWIGSDEAHFPPGSAPREDGGTADVDDRFSRDARQEDGVATSARDHHVPENAGQADGEVAAAVGLGSDNEPAADTARVQQTMAARARQAVADCGWDRVSIRAGLSFEDVFGAGFTPRPMQRDFIDAVDGPGLYVLEAPMGLGKTEAALYAAYKLMAAGHHHGLYFGLPTRLTSDRIHTRVRGFVAAITEGDSPVRLAHGHFWLREFDHGGTELGAGKSWFKPSKRALLLPFAVGTIDQALLAVLKVRHNFVRSFGLAGKVVILDEVHSYDVYTGTLLDLLARRLLEIGCTVIILSATLTRERRLCFLGSSSTLAFAENSPFAPCDVAVGTHKDVANPALNTPVVNLGPTVTSMEHYPLITCESGSGVRTVPSAPPAGIRMSVSISALEGIEVAELAVSKARERHCVVCIANTVAQAQRWYSQIKSAMPSGAFEVGLLHSKFPSRRRKDLEDLWMLRLGKHGDRAEGCVLVATQVVEQSVDIDADLMITELAPTDMLLQRLGRVWRHQRPDRPCSYPSVTIVTGDVDGAASFPELIDALGKSNSHVYAPYILWRSHRVWRQVRDVVLPDEIRGLLEATYAEGQEDVPEFIGQARRQLEARKQKLRHQANAARADVTGFCVMKDDESAATRYNDLPTIDAVLARSADTSSHRATLELCDGTRVKVDGYKKNPWVSAQLHQNLVSVPAFQLKGAQKPPFFRTCFFDTTVLLVIADDGSLLMDGQPTGLRYDNERGLQREQAEEPAPRGAGGWTVARTDAGRESASIDDGRTSARSGDDKNGPHNDGGTNGGRTNEKWNGTSSDNEFDEWEGTLGGLDW